MGQAFLRGVIRCGGTGTLREWILEASVGVSVVGEERIGSEEGEKCGLPSASICIETSSSSCCCNWFSSGCLWFWSSVIISISTESGICTAADSLIESAPCPTFSARSSGLRCRAVGAGIVTVVV